MDKIKVVLENREHYPANPYLNGLGRVNVSFSWVRRKRTGTLVTQTTPLPCRDHVIDFLEESFSKLREGQSRGMFGSIDEQRKGVDRTATRLLIKLYGKDAKKKFEDNFSFVLEQEKKWIPEVASTKLFEADVDMDLNGGSLLLVEGDPLWTKAACLNSYYTLLLRMCPNVGKPSISLQQIITKEPTDLAPTDVNYLRSANAFVSLEKYIPAMGKLDFSKAETPCGLADKEYYGHGLGAFQWMANYVQKPDFFRSNRQRNVYGDQLIEMTK